VLWRSSIANTLGEYEYRQLRPGPVNPTAWRQNFSDLTRYRFTVVGELWEKVGATWVKALKRTGTPVSESKTVIFSTGVSPRTLPTSSGPVQVHSGGQ
jgi:hypothetical protein